MDIILLFSGTTHHFLCKSLMHTSGIATKHIPLLFFPCVSQKVNVFSEIAVCQPVWVNISKLE